MYNEAYIPNTKHDVKEIRTEHVQILHCIWCMGGVSCTQCVHVSHGWSLVHTDGVVLKSSFFLARSGVRGGSAAVWGGGDKLWVTLSFSLPLTGCEECERRGRGVKGRRRQLGERELRGKRKYERGKDSDCRRK